MTCDGLTEYDIALLRQGRTYGVVWAYSQQAAALIDRGLMWRTRYYALTTPEGVAAATRRCWRR